MEWHPTCCDIFFVHFERRRTRITANKGILKQIAATITSQTFCIIKIVCVLLTIHVTPHFTLLMARRCRADRYLTKRKACELYSNAEAHREACELYAAQAHREASPLTSMAACLARTLSINGAQAAV